MSTIGRATPSFICTSAWFRFVRQREHTMRAGPR
jgi:hypothetical protein